MTPRAAIAHGGLSSPGSAHLLLGVAHYNTKRKDAALASLGEAKRYPDSAGCADQWIKLVKSGKGERAELRAGRERHGSGHGLCGQDRQRLNPLNRRKRRASCPEHRSASVDDHCRSQSRAERPDLPQLLATGAGPAGAGVLLGALPRRVLAEDAARARQVRRQLQVRRHARPGHRGHRQGGRRSSMADVNMVMRLMVKHGIEQRFAETIVIEVPGDKIGIKVGDGEHVHDRDRQDRDGQGRGRQDRQGSRTRSTARRSPRRSPATTARSPTTSSSDSDGKTLHRSVTSTARECRSRSSTSSTTCASKRLSARRRRRPRRPLPAAPG